MLYHILLLNAESYIVNHYYITHLFGCFIHNTTVVNIQPINASPNNTTSAMTNFMYILSSSLEHVSVSIVLLVPTTRSGNPDIIISGLPLLQLFNISASTELWLDWVPIMFAVYVSLLALVSHCSCSSEKYLSDLMQEQFWLRMPINCCLTSTSSLFEQELLL